MHSPQSHWCPSIIQSKIGGIGSAWPVLQMHFQGQSHQANPNKPAKPCFSWWSWAVAPTSLDTPCCITPSNTTSICLWSRQGECQVNQRKARHTANAHLAAWCCIWFQSLRLWYQINTTMSSGPLLVQAWQQSRPTQQVQSCLAAKSQLGTRKQAYTKRIQMTRLKALKNTFDQKAWKYCRNDQSQNKNGQQYNKM